MRSRCGCAPSRRPTISCRAAAAVVDWHVPPGVRCDHALAPGATVTAWYDSMVAKLIAHAPTRAECIERLADALDHTVLLGLPSNRAFLARVLRHEAFVERSRRLDRLHRRAFRRRVRAARPRPIARTWALAAWLSVAAAPETLDTVRRLASLEHRSPLAAARGACAGRLRRPCARDLPHDVRGRVTPGPRRRCRRDWRSAIRNRGRRQDRRVLDARATIDGEPLDYRYAWDGRDALAAHDRRRLRVRVSPSRAGAVGRCRRQRRARSACVDQCPGGEVVVQAGARVQPGDRLVVLEAMKMEHEVRANARRDGRRGRRARRRAGRPGPGARALRKERRDDVVLKVVVTCALTGVLTDPAQHHVPVTPERDGARGARRLRRRRQRRARALPAAGAGQGPLAVVGAGGRARDRAGDPRRLPRHRLQPVDRRGRPRHFGARRVHAGDPARNRGGQRRLAQLPEGAQRRTLGLEADAVRQPGGKDRGVPAGHAGNRCAAGIRVLRRRHRARRSTCT